MANEIQVKVPFWTSLRFRVGLILSFGCFNVYTLRTNINMAVVCMVNHTAIKAVTTSVNHTSSGLVLNECIMNENNATDAEFEDGELKWDKSTQGEILGAFFWPYAILQIPSGILVTKCGAKNVFGYSMILSSLVTILLPIVSIYNHIYTISLRALLGLFQAPYGPCCLYYLGHWVHPTERSRLISILIVGEQLGVIAGFLGTGYLCRYGFAGGWPSAFYIFGTFSLVWSIIWLAFTSDVPEESTMISTEEKTFIMEGLKKREETNKFQKNRIPWKYIFTSIPVYAVTFSFFTSDWAVYFISTYIPTYIDDVFHFKVEDNGVISALTSLPQCVMVLICGWLADVIHKKYLSLTGTRKLFTILSSVLPAVLLTILGHIDCSQPVTAITLMTIGITIRGLRAAGSEITAADIAPQYSGLIFSFANTASAIAGYLATVVTSNITKNSLREEWQICFYITAAVEIFGGIFFSIFASSEIQPWALDSTFDKDNIPDDKHIKIIRWRRQENGETTKKHLTNIPEA